MKITANPLLTPTTAAAPWDAWTLGWMVTEMWVTSAYNIASRTSWLSTADPTGAAAWREWQRMLSEKMMASLEVGMEIQRASYDFWTGRFDIWNQGTRVLRPLHRRTVSNSKRLANRRGSR